MIFTRESGSQEQFDEKNLRSKITWYYPFKQCFRAAKSGFLEAKHISQ
jgi:hypothetical protein